MIKYNIKNNRLVVKVKSSVNPNSNNPSEENSQSDEEKAKDIFRKVSARRNATAETVKSALHLFFNVANCDSNNNETFDLTQAFERIKHFPKNFRTKFQTLYPQSDFEVGKCFLSLGHSNEITASRRNVIRGLSVIFSFRGGLKHKQIKNYVQRYFKEKVLGSKFDVHILQLGQVNSLIFSSKTVDYRLCPLRRNVLNYHKNNENQFSYNYPRESNIVPIRLSHSQVQSRSYNVCYIQEYFALRGDKKRNRSWLLFAETFSRFDRFVTSHKSSSSSSSD